MKEIINWLMAKAKRFTVLDWAVLKVLLLSLGTMIGAYFSNFFKKLAPLMWIIVALSYGYMIYRMLFTNGKMKFKVIRF